MFFDALSQNYWSPFRDWNFRIFRWNWFYPFSLKTTEALLGIETGIASDVLDTSRRLKTTEALLGIETYLIRSTEDTLSRLKTTEALLGIETAASVTPTASTVGVSKLLKPF